MLTLSVIIIFFCIVLFLDEDQHETLTGVTRDPSVVPLDQLLEPLIRQQRDTTDKLATLTSHVLTLEQQIRASYLGSRWQYVSERDVAVVLIAVILQLAVVWMFK